MTTEKIKELNLKLLHSFGISYSEEPSGLLSNVGLKRFLADSTKNASRFFIDISGLVKSHGREKEQLNCNLVYYLHHIENISVEEISQRADKSLPEIQRLVNSKKFTLSKKEKNEMALNFRLDALKKELETEVFERSLKVSKYVTQESEYIRKRGISERVSKEEGIYHIIDGEGLLGEIEENKNLLLEVIGKLEKKYENDFFINKNLAEFKKGYEYTSINRNKLTNYETVLTVRDGDEKTFLMRQKKDANVNSKYTQIGRGLNRTVKHSEDTVFIIEGQMDYFTFLSYYEQRPELEMPSFYVLFKATAGVSKEELEFLNSHKNKVFFLDNDEAGENLTYELIEKFMVEDKRSIFGVKLFNKYIESKNMGTNDINDLYIEDMQNKKDRLIGFINEKTDKYNLEKPKRPIEYATKEDVQAAKGVILDKNKKYLHSMLDGRECYIDSPFGYVKLSEEEVNIYLMTNRRTYLKLFFYSEDRRPSEPILTINTMEDLKKYTYMKIKKNYPELNLSDKENEDILERVKKEFDILNQLSGLFDDVEKKRFINYFVLNSELSDTFEEIRRVTDKRGSAGAFILNDLLGITHSSLKKIREKVSDPLIIPERFLSPGRKDMPDVDYEVGTGNDFDSQIEKIRTKFNLKRGITVSDLRDDKTAPLNATVEMLDESDVSTSTHVCTNHFVTEGYLETNGVPISQLRSDGLPYTSDELDEYFTNVDLISYGGVLNKYQEAFDAGNYEKIRDFYEDLEKYQDISLFTVITTPKLPHMTKMAKPFLIKLIEDNIFKNKDARVDTVWIKAKHPGGEEKNTQYIRTLSGKWRSPELREELTDEEAEARKGEPLKPFKNDVTDLHTFSNVFFGDEYKEYLTDSDMEGYKTTFISDDLLGVASAINRPSFSARIYKVQGKDGKNYVLTQENQEDPSRLVSTCGTIEVELSEENQKEFGNYKDEVVLAGQKDISLNGQKLKKEQVSDSIIEQHKEGKSFEVFDFLNSTYGFIIYQEQVMLFMKKIAEETGLTPELAAALENVGKAISSLRKKLTKENAHLLQGEMDELTALLEQMAEQTGLSVDMVGVFATWDESINLLRKYLSKSSSHLSERDIREAAGLFEKVEKFVLGIQNPKSKKEAMEILYNQLFLFKKGAFMMSKIHNDHLKEQAKNVGVLEELKVDPKRAYKRENVKPKPKIVEIVGRKGDKKGQVIGYKIDGSKNDQDTVWLSRQNMTAAKAKSILENKINGDEKPYVKKMSNQPSEESAEIKTITLYDTITVKKTLKKGGDVTILSTYKLQDGYGNRYKKIAEKINGREVPEEEIKDEVIEIKNNIARKGDKNKYVEIVKYQGKETNKKVWLEGYTEVEKSYTPKRRGKPTGKYP